MWRGLETYWHNWLLKRQPKASQFSLNRHNLYTFPGASGLTYLCLTLILWLIGTNYQNNLILALAYGLMSIFVVAILHAYANLAGVKLEAIPAKAVFVGDMAEITLCLTANNKRGAENLRCQFRGQPSIAVELECQQPLTINVPVAALQRGWLVPGRFLIETYYPLGLIRCWTWLHFDQAILVYPHPLAKPLPIIPDDGNGEMPGAIHSGGSEFDGLKAYKPGDARKLIAWKAVAKGRGLFTKQYADEISREHWLDISHLNISIEDRLSVLTYWVVKLSAQNQTFGLRLFKQIIAPSQGDLHRLECLKALALFERVDK